jgi:rhamnosyltransferase
MSSASLTDCAFVVVLYHTDPLEHVERLRPIIALGARGYLVDNTPRDLAQASQLEVGLRHVPLGRNAGIAHALNVGVQMAFDDGARHVFTFDQDSEIDSTLMTSLLDAYRIHESMGRRRLALGPHPVNKITGASYLRRRDRLRVWWHRQRRDSESFLPTAEIITSGLLSNHETWVAAGPYDEALFIDFVDHDWCWRLRRNSGICGVELSVPLAHMVGQGDVPYTLGMKLGAASRLFFLFRNGVYLILRGRMPILDAIKFLALIPAKLMVFGLMRDRLERWRQIFRGLREGLRMAGRR